MASTMAANATSVHHVSITPVESGQRVTIDLQVRRTRGANMGSAGMSSDRTHASQSHSVGKGFGTGKASWNSNIWGDSNLGGSFGDGQLLARIFGLDLNANLSV